MQTLSLYKLAEIEGVTKLSHNTAIELVQETRKVAATYSSCVSTQHQALSAMHSDGFACSAKETPSERTISLYHN